MKATKWVVAVACLLLASCAEKSPLDKTIEEISSVMPIEISEYARVDSVKRMGNRVDIFVSSSALGSKEDWKRRGYEDYAIRQMGNNLSASIADPKGAAFYLRKLFNEIHAAKGTALFKVTATEAKKTVDLVFSARQIAYVLSEDFKAPSRYDGLSEEKVLRRVIYEVRDELGKADTTGIWLADAVLAPDEFMLINKMNEKAIPIDRVVSNPDGLRESVLNQLKENDDSYIIAAACARTGRKFSMRYEGATNGRGITVSFTPDEMIEKLGLPVDEEEDEYDEEEDTPLLPLPPTIGQE